MRKVKLGDICTIISGTTPKSKIKEYWGGDNVWITPAELDENSFIINDSERHITDLAVTKSGLKSFPKGTVILSSRAPIGKTAIAGCKMYCNQGFKNLICSNAIYNVYLYYYLKSKTLYLNSLGRGATFKEISKRLVEDIEIPLPEKKKQIKIGNTLRAIEILIEKRNKQLLLFEELIKSRFIEMFGELGKDDKEWGLTKLGECCELNPKRPRNIKDELLVSFVPMPAVSEDGKIDCSDIRPYKEVSKGFTYFEENDVLFAKITPSMENGKGAVAKGLVNGIGSGSTEFHVLRPIVGKSNPYWLYIITMFKSFRLGAKKVMTGTGGQLRVPIGYLNNYPISLPPIELQNNFEDFVHRIDKSRMAVQKSLDELELLKKSLLQEYFGC